MAFLNHLPGLRALTAAVFVYAVVWMSLEGGLEATLLLGTGLALTGLGHLGGRLLGGKQLGSGRWLGAAAAAGFLFGLAAGGLTLGLMALKTGLHAHGPEFSRAEVAWVVGRTPLWAAAGLLAGLALGLLGLYAGRE